MREGKRVREELSSHIWVDGTHGESMLERSASSPEFSCAFSPALYVPQTFLVCSNQIHLPLSTSNPPLPLFLISTFYFYPISAPYTLPSLLPLCLKRSQMLLYERQLRSVIFSASVTGSGPLWKKERGTKKESHRVQGSTARGETKKCHQHTHISHTCPHVGHRHSQMRPHTLKNVGFF